MYPSCAPLLTLLVHRSCTPPTPLLHPSRQLLLHTRPAPLSHPSCTPPAHPSSTPIAPLLHLSYIPALSSCSCSSPRPPPPPPCSCRPRQPRHLLDQPVPPQGKRGVGHLLLRGLRCYAQHRLLLRCDAHSSHGLGAGGSMTPTQTRTCAYCVRRGEKRTKERLQPDRQLQVVLPAPSFAVPCPLPALPLT